MTNQRANAKTTADPFGMTTRNAKATVGGTTLVFAFYEVLSERF
jgi:hypothetical protein